MKIAASRPTSGKMATVSVAPAWADGSEEAWEQEDRQEGRKLDEHVGEAAGRAAVFRLGDHGRDGHAVGGVPVMPPQHRRRRMKGSMAVLPV